MKINFILVAIFALGIVTQSLMMLGGQWKKGDWKLIAWSFGLSLVALLPGRSEDDYDLRIHLLYVCVLGVGWFTGAFRERLISRVGARSLIILNAVLIYLSVSHFNVSSALLIVLCVPSILTLINGFTDIDRQYFWQVFFYLWFLCMILLVTIFYFSFGGLMNIFGFQAGIVGLGYLQSFVLGAAFFYIISNAWFVIEAVPLPGKHQTFANRLIEVKKHLQLLAYGYVWQEGDRYANLLVLIAMPLILFANYRYGFISERSLVSLILTVSSMMYFFDRQVKMDDGIGCMDENNKATFLK